MGHMKLKGFLIKSQELWELQAPPHAPLCYFSWSHEDINICHCFIRVRSASCYLWACCLLKIVFLRGKKGRDEVYHREALAWKLVTFQSPQIPAPIKTDWVQPPDVKAMTSSSRWGLPRGSLMPWLSLGEKTVLNLTCVCLLKKKKLFLCEIIYA